MRDMQSSQAPPLVPNEFIEILRDADALLALMGREPLDVVGELATQLTACANEAGAHEIANAASVVSQIASAHEAVALAGAMQRLTAAMSDAQHAYRLDTA